MNTQILLDNEKKRLDYPLSRLICFAMFNIWQMGFIYYMGPALTIHDKTPLPIDMDSTTTIIAAGYVICILWIIFLPKKFVLAARVSTIVALLTAVGVLMPLPAETLALLLYVQCFCCCFMIGFESSTIVYLLSEKTAILHLLVAYAIGYLIIAALQNDVAMLPFGIFRWAILVMIALLLYFYMKLPTNAFPTFANRRSGLVFPKKLFIGTFVFIFFACLMGVIAPAAAAETEHGVSFIYLFAAITAFIMYFLHKKAAIHPLRSVSVAVGLGIIGFVLLYATNYVPALALPACALLGAGLIPCALIPLFGLELMRTYPSKLIPAIIMAFAVVAVLIQSSLVEMFRDSMQLLSISYLVIVIITAVVYMLLEPLLLHSLREKYSYSRASRSTTDNEAAADDISDSTHAISISEIDPKTLPEPFNCLTARELEVTDLLCHGHTNRDVAKMLFISEHTVKDHTKSIYRKLGVHSRFELVTMINRIKS